MLMPPLREQTTAEMRSYDKRSVRLFFFLFENLESLNFEEFESTGWEENLEIEITNFLIIRFNIFVYVLLCYRLITIEKETRKFSS